MNKPSLFEFHAVTNATLESATTARQRPTQALVRRGPKPLALEQRFMFDGAAAADALHALDSAIDASARDTATVEKLPGSAAQWDGVVRAVPNATEILFIDSGVADIATLVASARAGVEVVVLNAAGDPWAQMTQAISQFQNLEAVHLVSHGSSGEVLLGGKSYGAGTLIAESGQLAAWSAHLSQDADIFIYGCEVAAGQAGEQLLTSLAQLTSADIAASVDATGAASLGGNWVLERQTGAVEARALDFSHYDDLLATPTSAYDTNFGALNFSTGALLSGKANTVGAQYVYRNVITVGGQAIDSVVTVKAVDAGVTISVVDNATSGVLGNFQATTSSTAGGAVTYQFDFYKHVDTGAPAEAVILQNVRVNAYDIDGAGSMHEYQQFQGFTSYTLDTSTKLQALSSGNGFTSFQDTSGVNATDPVTKSNLSLGPANHARMNYHSISSFLYKAGMTASGTGRLSSLEFAMGTAFANESTVGNSVLTANPDSGIATTAGGTGGSNPSGNVIAGDGGGSLSDTGTGIKVSKVETGSTIDANASSVAASSTSSANPTVLVGNYGTLAMGADGTYAYTVDGSNATIRTMTASSAPLTDTFPIWSQTAPTRPPAPH